MNSSTRRLVYSSLIFAVTTLCANADPIHKHPGSETVTAVDNTNLRSSGTLVLGSDITQSSFSESHNLTANQSFSNGREERLEDVTRIAPTSGKVESTVTTHLSASGSASPSQSADLSTTDALGALPEPSRESTKSPAVTSDGTNHAAAEARTANSDVVDAPDPSASNSDSVPVQGVIVGNTSAPEPSTMVMAGSIFIGFGLLKLRRKKRA